MRRRQGQLDSPLTEDGRRHAETVTDLCVARGADSVFSSPLGRARVTADVVGSRLSLPVVVVSDLAEIDHGAFAGLTNEEIEARHPGELARRAESRYTWSFPGGESYANAPARVGTAVLTPDSSASSRRTASSADSPSWMPPPGTCVPASTSTWSKTSRRPLGSGHVSHGSLIAARMPARHCRQLLCTADSLTAVLLHVLILPDTSRVRRRCRPRLLQSRGVPRRTASPAGHLHRGRVLGSPSQRVPPLLRERGLLPRWASIAER